MTSWKLWFPCTHSATSEAGTDPARGAPRSSRVNRAHVRRGWAAPRRARAQRAGAAPPAPAYVRPRTAPRAAPGAERCRAECRPRRLPPRARARCRRPWCCGSLLVAELCLLGGAAQGESRALATADDLGDGVEVAGPPLPLVAGGGVTVL